MLVMGVAAWATHNIDISDSVLVGLRRWLNSSNRARDRWGTSVGAAARRNSDVPRPRDRGVVRVWGLGVRTNRLIIDGVIYLDGIARH
jgi:hypothetical protein